MAIQGTTSATATSPAARTGSAAPTTAPSSGVTSGMGAAAPTLLLDIGSSPSDGGLSGLRLPQSSEDITAILAEVEMKLNSTMSRTRSAGIVGAFAVRLGALGAASAAITAQGKAAGDLAKGRSDLSAGQTALKTDQGELDASTSDLKAAGDDLATDQAALDAAKTDLKAHEDDRNAAQSQADADTSQIAALQAQPGNADTDKKIADLTADLGVQNDRVKLDGSWIDTHHNDIPAIQDKIDADNARIKTDTDDIKAEQGKVDADNKAIKAADDAISDATKAMAVAAQHLQAASLIVSSQLALTSGTDDRSRHNVAVSTQLDLGFERLQKSAEEIRHKDQRRDGEAPAAPNGRPETLAVGLTAALEAARATLQQLVQQATAASAASPVDRHRLSL